jgi:hypothetical protein
MNSTPEPARWQMAVAVLTHSFIGGFHTELRYVRLRLLVRTPTYIPQRDLLAPQTRAPVLWTFCSFGLLWPVMALACGSLQTVLTLVPSG